MLNLVVTSAWRPLIPRPEAEVGLRRERLLESLRHYAHLGMFSQIYLLDSSIDDAGRDTLAALNLPRLSVVGSPQPVTGIFQGPSYLEGLLYASVTDAFPGQSDATYVKITGGYIVENLEQIVRVYRDRSLEVLSFVLQNPLRTAPKFAMTSCYLLNARHWQALLSWISQRCETLRMLPLELQYCRFLLESGCRRGVSAPYPQFDAYFSTARTHSSSLNYQAREWCWRLLSRLGLFTLTK